jgi:hypothetical protein
MNPSTGQDINQKVFDRMDRLHKKQIEKQIPALRDKQIFESLGNDIMTDQTAIKSLREKGFSEDEAVESINNLLQSEKLIHSIGLNSGKLYLRKNLYK